MRRDWSNTTINSKSFRRFILLTSELCEAAIGKTQRKKLLLNEFEILWEFSPKDIYLHSRNGGLAQLARALAWHARGHRFDSDILH